MTFKDYIGKKAISHRTEPSNQSSLNNEIKKKHHHKFKRLHISVLDLLQWYPSKENLENKNIQQQQQQQQESFPRCHSIIKSSDAPRTLSKKSVTFASAFDLVDKKQDIEEKAEEEEVTYNLESNLNNEILFEEDLVTIIPNKQSIDGTTINTNENIEPYPFRSEIPLSHTNSFNDDTANSDYSSKKINHHFISHHRPKKLRHPIQTTDPVSKINRSNSAPNLIISSGLSQPSTTNNQQRRLKAVRTWFKLTKVGRFVHSLHKKSQQNQTNNFTNKNSKFHSPSTELRRLSELLY